MECLPPETLYQQSKPVWPLAASSIYFHLAMIDVEQEAEEH
jgi:hypothetical protein